MIKFSEFKYLYGRYKIYQLCFGLVLIAIFSGMFGFLSSFFLHMPQQLDRLADLSKELSFTDAGQLFQYLGHHQEIMFSIYSSYQQLAFVCLFIATLYMLLKCIKYSLGKMIFKPYKYLNVSSDFSRVSWKQTLQFFAIANLLPALVSFIFGGANVFSMIISSLLGLGTEYLMLNIFVEKYLQIERKI